MEQGYQAHPRPESAYPAADHGGRRRNRERRSRRRCRLRRQRLHDVRCTSRPLLRRSAEAVRAPAQAAGRRSRAAARRARTRHADPGHAVRQGLEQYKLFFLEDPLSPEDIGYFEQHPRSSARRRSRWASCSTARTSGSPLITERLIDFIRIHISQIGGLTPARKMAALCEYFGVRTAWHGPGDVSPVGHAANLHLDLASYNFGIQEGGIIGGVGRDLQGLRDVQGRLSVGQRLAGLGHRSGREAGRQVPVRRHRATVTRKSERRMGRSAVTDGTIIKQ